MFYIVESTSVFLELNLYSGEREKRKRSSGMGMDSVGLDYAKCDCMEWNPNTIHASTRNRARVSHTPKCVAH